MTEIRERKVILCSDFIGDLYRISKKIRSGLAVTKCGQFAIEFGDRESHDVVKASLDSFYADVSHPVLYSVRTCFVERGKVLNVMLDFGGAEWVECDLGFVVKGM